jgi:3-oxoacyl-[acyl-carrier protein] reductase
MVGPPGCGARVRALLPSGEVGELPSASQPGSASGTSTRANARRFETRTALITGAAGGIGAAVATRLATEGAAVTLVDRVDSPPTELATVITENGGRCLCSPGDVTRRGDLDAAVSATMEAFGRLDIVVTCAGVLRDNLIDRMSEDDWNCVVDTNLKGAFLTVQAAHEALMRQPGGRVVFLSSVAVFGNRGQANYSSAKGGLQSLARTLALELGPLGITVNALAPGFVDTAMTRSVALRAGVPYEELVHAASQATPVRRVATAGEMAGIVAFLCSDEAGFITGQTIVARGGP